MIINRPKYVTRTKIVYNNKDPEYYDWTFESSVFGYRTTIATYITEFFTDLNA